MCRVIFFVTTLVLMLNSSFAADRYWVGGGASTNWDATANTNWSATSGGANNASVPVTGDEVYFDGNSGTATSVISANITIRSLNCTGYTGTLQHDAAIVLTIGDGTAGTGNIALKYVAGMTLTLGNYASSEVLFASTIGTVQSVDWGGKTTANVTYDGAGGSWQLASSHVMEFGSVLKFTNGTFDTNNLAMTLGSFYSKDAGVKTLTLGSSQITVIGGFTALNMKHWQAKSGGALITVTANTATVTLERSPRNEILFHSEADQNWNGLSLVVNGGGLTTLWTGSSGTLVNPTTFRAITINGTTSSSVGVNRLYILDAGIIVTGNLNLNGKSSNRMLFDNKRSTVDINLTGAATSSLEHVDFKNIKMTNAVDYSGITGGARDKGSNTNITFTTFTPTTYYWYTTAAGNYDWSDVGNWYLASNGAGGNHTRVPFDIDDIVFDSNSVGAANTTINANISELGKDITWTGVTNNPVWHFTSDVSVFGSLVLDPNMSMTVVDAVRFLYMKANGSGNTFNFTTSGVTFPHQLVYFTLTDNTNTIILQDNFTANHIYFRNGIFIANNIDLNVFSVYIRQDSSTVLNMGSGTWDLSGTYSIYNTTLVWRHHSGTVNANTSTIKLSNTSSTRKYMGGGANATYNNLLISGAGEAVYEFQESYTFNVFQTEKTVPHSILFKAGENITVSTFTVNGSADALVTIGSVTDATHTLTYAGGSSVNIDYVHITNSVGSAADWNAGVNSVDGGNNTNWAFAGGDLPGTWTDANGANSNWNNTGNWAGGAIPGNGVQVYFIKKYNTSCTIDIAVDVKGISFGQGYTQTLTQGANIMAIGSNGLDIKSGIFTGGTQNITSTGRVLQTGGTFTNTNTTFQVTAQNGSTFDVNAGTFTHNSGLVTVVGTLDANVVAPTGSPLNNLTINTTGTVGGTIYIANDLTRSAGNNLDADIYLSGDYLGAGGTSGGTGTIRFTGAGTQSFTNPNAPAVVVNTTGPLLIPADITVGGSWAQNAGTVTWNSNKATFNNVTDADITITSGVFYDLELTKLATNDVALSGDATIANDFTITSLAELNGSSAIVSGNYIVTPVTWTGTGKVLFSGTGNSSISGVGRQGVTTEINKTGGTVTLTANFDIYNSGHDMSVTAGGLDLAGFNLTVADIFTVNGTMSLKGSETITVNSLTSSAAANAKFTISPTTSTIVYTDSAVTATITSLAKTFYNLTFGASKTHEIATGGGNGITVAGAMSSNGTSASRSVLRSVADSSTTWELTLNGTSTVADKVDVKNSDASSGTAVLATGSLGRGTNTNWVGLVSLPTVASVLSTSNSGSYAKNETINIQVTFSEAVVLTGGNLLVALNSGATVIITPFALGTVATGVYTVGNGENISSLNSSTLSLSAGTLRNGSAQDVDLSLPATNITSNRSIVIDTIAPTFTSSTLGSANAFVDIVFDSAVYNTSGGSGAITASDFVLTFAANSGSATAVSISSVTTILGAALAGGETTIRLVLSITGTVSGTETIVVIPATTAIYDFAGNAAAVSNTSGTLSLTDQLVPTVSSVTSTTENGAYKTADIIVIEVSFSEAVTVVGIPKLTLETGTPDQSVSYTSGSGSTKLLFNYTVVDGDDSSDLDYVATTSLALNSGTVKDAAGNNAILTLPTVGASNSLGANKILVVDTTLPTISNGALSADNTYVDVIFSEAIYAATGSGPLLVSDLSLIFTANSGTATDVVIASLLTTSDGALAGGETTIRAMLTVTGTVSGVETINVKPVAANIFDIVGNNASASETTGELALLVSGSTPTVLNITSEATNGVYDIADTIAITVKFSEIVTVSGTPSLTLETGDTDATALFTSGSGSDTLTFEYVVSVGDSSADLDTQATSSLNVNTGSIKSTSSVTANLTLPASAATGSLGANKDIAIVTSAPVVSSITTTKANGTYGVGAVIPFKVTFSRSVTLSGGEIKIALNTGAILVITVISGTEVEISYTVGEGESSSDLDVNEVMLTSGGSIVDSKGRSLVLTLPATTFASVFAIVIDPTVISTENTSSGGGGGCSYSKSAGNEGSAEWLALLLIIFISVSFMKNRE